MGQARSSHSASDCRQSSSDDACARTRSTSSAPPMPGESEPSSTTSSATLRSSYRARVGRIRCHRRRPSQRLPAGDAQARHGRRRRSRSRVPFTESAGLLRHNDYWRQTYQLPSYVPTTGWRSASSMRCAAPGSTSPGDPLGHWLRRQHAGTAGPHRSHIGQPEARRAGRPRSRGRRGAAR